MANFAEYINREDAQSNSATREEAVESGVTVFNRDFVGYGANGRLTSAGIATLKLLGMVMGGDTQLIGRSQRTFQTGEISTTGNAAGSKKVLVNIENEAQYLLKATGALTQAVVGSTFNLQGTAGSQLVNATPAASGAAGTGQFELVRLAKGIRGTDNTYGVFRIRK